MAAVTDAGGASAVGCRAKSPVAVTSMVSVACRAAAAACLACVAYAAAIGVGAGRESTAGGRTWLRPQPGRTYLRAQRDVNVVRLTGSGRADATGGTVCLAGRF